MRSKCLTRRIDVEAGGSSKRDRGAHLACHRPSEATAFGISIKQHEAVLCAEIDLEHLLLELGPAYWTIEEKL